MAAATSPQQQPATATASDPLAAVSTRIRFFRICFIGCLLAAAIVCATVAYIAIDQLEQSVGLETYQSVAALALVNAQALTRLRLEGGTTMALMYKHAFPNATQWPFVALEGYVEIANHIAAQTNAVTMALDMIVQPGEQALEFEQWAWKTYRNQGYPMTAGVSKNSSGDDFFGIYAFDEDRNRFHATNTANRSWDSPNDILVPIFQHKNIHASSILFDIHSRSVFGKQIDSMLACAEEYATTDGSSPDCRAVTGLTELIVRPGPATLIYEPVYPANDPTTQVAYMGSTLHWEEVLTNIVPEHVSLYAVITSSSDDSVTFAIKDGVPKLLEDEETGEWITKDFSTSARSLAKRAVLTRFQTGARATTNYTLTIYPYDEDFEEYRTNSALFTSIGFVAVILFCGCMFYAYDFFVKSESHQRKAILQVKRQFVRFISHEIRSPLNTVCMGLELLKADLKRYLSSSSSSSSSSQDFLPVKKQILKEWLELTNDVNENSSDAVLVLNDLLHYDKIESGTLQLFLGEVNMKDITNRVCSQLAMAAKNQRINLTFECQGEGTTGNHKQDKQDRANSATSEDTTAPKILGKGAAGVGNDGDERLVVFADEHRIRQVIRNLVSNALKFTPESGNVSVQVSFHTSSDRSSSSSMATKTNSLIEEFIKNNEFESSCFSRAGRVSVTVKDSGVGMSPEQLHRLFGEGVQFDADKLQAGGGSGLGLWISKGIVESHAGTLTADSQGKDLGSTFQMSLPLFKIKEAFQNATVSTDDHSEEEFGMSDTNSGGGSGGGATRPPPNDTTAASSTAGVMKDSSVSSSIRREALENRRILVVDDSAMNRKMLVRLLERSGHICEAACDGDEAVEIIADDLKKRGEVGDVETGLPHQAFDTILMDNVMPKLSGPEATAQIRELGYQGLVVGVTGNVLPEDVAHFKSKGADSVLGKPVRLGLLDRIWENQKPKHPVNQEPPKESYA